jgi:voltage-gated potassium channel Kch
LQLLSDRNELNTNVGNQTFSILLFQDLLSIPILAMLPVFAGKSFNFGAAAIDIAVLSLLLVVSVVFVGRVILNPLLKRVVKLKSREALLLTVMLNIVVWATVLDMMSLPVGLGAFLAGMLMSETIYRHQISAEISPYSMLFLAFFFIALGMGLNVPLLLDKWYYVLVGLAGLVFVKFMALFMVSRVRGMMVPDATFMALILAQGGEFGLLMLQTMKTAGISAIPATSSEVLTAIIIMSIMTTPIILAIYDFLRRRGWIFATYRPRSLDRSGLETNPQVVILGFGRVGQIVAKLMEQNGVSYVAIDMDVNAIVRGREMGYNVVFGNCKNADVLRNFGLHPRKTSAVIVALDNAETAKDAVLTVKTIAPHVKIFARARNLADCKALRKYGVFSALPETIETAFSLGCGVLKYVKVSDTKVCNVLKELRNDDYAKIDTCAPMTE